MNCITPGLPVHHQLPEFTQTHVHRVGDVSYVNSYLKHFRALISVAPEEREWARDRRQDGGLGLPFPPSPREGQSRRLTEALEEGGLVVRGSGRERQVP